MSPRRYLVLAGVTVSSAIGDTLLSRGMKDVGSISLSNIPHIIFAVTNPWVALGIVFLLTFFACYAAALSWADLTYVLPATSVGYVLLALIAKYELHEQITTGRWFGIALITMGVGFVAGGPAKTTGRKVLPARDPSPAPEPVSSRGHR